jgi:hypothetical protein
MSARTDRMFRTILAHYDTAFACVNWPLDKLLSIILNQRYARSVNGPTRIG